MKRWFAHVLGFGFVALYLWPLVLAVWVSFSAGSMLAVPESYSLRWYVQFFESARWTGALLESLEVAAISAAFAIVSAFGLAMGVVRHRLPGVSALSRLTLLPMFLPAVVLGMAFLPVFRWSGIWGTSWSLGIAHAVWTLPVAYLILRDSLEELDEDLILAARGLGASPGDVLLHVILPLVGPSILVAGVVAYVLSINEFVIALFVGTPETETLPRVIWPSLRYTLTPIVSAASGVSLVFAVAAGLMLWWGIRFLRK